jgi:hypothetical protein
MDTVRGFHPGVRYKARSARDNLKDVLDAAEAGAVPVISRTRPVAAVTVDVLEELLAQHAPFNVVSSVTDEQVAFWLEDGLVHAVGADLDEATAAFLDALVDYAEDWLEDLRDAPNHAHNRMLVLRTAIHAGDRDALEAAVFGD